MLKLGSLFLLPVGLIISSLLISPQRGGPDAEILYAMHQTAPVRRVAQLPPAPVAASLLHPSRPIGSDDMQRFTLAREATQELPPILREGEAEFVPRHRTVRETTGVEFVELKFARRRHSLMLDGIHN